MIFQKINLQKDLKTITDIWNKEYQLIFPISYALMERNTNNAYLEASFIVKENEEIAGFIISKIYDNSYCKETYEEFGLSPDKETVLFFAGGEFGLGRTTTIMVLKVL